MPDGLRLMPVEAEVAPCDRQIRCHSQFFACARSQQGAVVANTKTEAAFTGEAGGVGSTLANLIEQCKFASSAAGWGMGLFDSHLNYEDMTIRR